MAEHSSMLPLGTIAPPFRLMDALSNQFYSLDEIKSDHATVIMFICNHCPYVQYILPTLLDMIQHYQTHGIKFIAICSNDGHAYPEDNVENMKLVAEKYAYPFPYLHDDTQQIARAYHAVCTPDFFVFDKKLHCIYRGRFDDATPRNHLPVTGNDLRNALDNILAGRAITSSSQQPSMGCGIKWKK